MSPKRRVASAICPENVEMVQPAFDAAFADRYEDFRAALIEARDIMGFMLAETWKRLTADYFTYRDVAETMIAVEAAMAGGRYRRAMVESFAWREIGRVGRRPAPQAAGAEQPHPLATDDHAGHGQRLAANELPRTGDRGRDCRS